MLAFTRIQLLSFAAAGVFAVLTVATAATRSDYPWVRLGPVGPSDPILTTVGNKHIIAFYEPGDGYCNIYVVANDRNDVSGASAEQVRVGLAPGQMAHIDTAQNESLNLQCGDDAESLAVAK
jgi:hypothetical protein